MLSSEKINPLRPTEYPLPACSPKQFVLIGGFLGAGKTTAICEFAQWLKKQGLKPAVITNDQSDGLIDTAITKRRDNVIQEVTGGCFCCRAQELGKALSTLEAEAHPDIFIAEPVGSCTDLVATVILPLKQIYEGHLQAAPMTVMIDAFRLSNNLIAKSKSMREKSKFSPDVQYIFEKQIEESEFLALNKIDLLSSDQKNKLIKILSERHPGKVIFPISTISKNGLESWFEKLVTHKSNPSRVMEVDYERYALGEALLGWYNATLAVHSTGPLLDGNKLLLNLARKIQKELEIKGARLAHFKMSLRQRDGELAVVNVVQNGSSPALSIPGNKKVFAAELLINLRAEADPRLLDQVVGTQIGLSQKSWQAIWKRKDAFQPGKPQPTYRSSLA